MVKRKAQQSARADELSQAVNALFSLGLNYHLKGEWVHAKQIYEQVLATQPKHFDALHMLGVLAMQSHDPLQAERLMAKAIAADPRHPQVYSNRGNALRALGRLDEAVESYRHAIELKPDYSEAYSNLGNVLKDQGNHAGAETAYAQAIGLMPHLVEAHFNRATVLEDMSRLDDAIVSYGLAIQLKPDYAEAHTNLGNVLRKLGRLEESLAMHDRVILLRPLDAEAHYNRGVLMQELGRSEEALAGYEEAIRLNPSHAQAHANRGSVLLALERLDESIQSSLRAIELKPNYASAHSNCGNAMRLQGRMEDALHHFDLAIDLAPDFALAHLNKGHLWLQQNDLYAALGCYQEASRLDKKCADAFLYQGLVLEDLRRPAEAFSYYQAALEAVPGHWATRWNLAISSLKNQRMECGWKHYASRLWIKNAAVPAWHPDLPKWGGEKLQGRVLLVAEQGLGDEIFFTKNLNLYIDTFGVPEGVTVDRRLISMFQRSFPNVQFYDRSMVNQLDPGAFDLQLPLGDLGILLSSDPARQPVLALPHLKPDLALPNPFNEIATLKGRPRIGLSWKSSNQKTGTVKSLALKYMLERLTDIEADWINLQYGDVSDEIAQVHDELGMKVQQVAGVDVMQDLEGLLRLIYGCDLIITVTNSTAHLCGAIGKPGFVLSPYGRNRLWYWHLEDGPSVWYQSLQIAHARQANFWDDAMDQAKLWLNDKISSNARLRLTESRP